MADMTAPATTPSAASPAKAKPERLCYQAGSGRRIAFAFVFLLLLPFYISLPAMFYQRIASGLWIDLAGLVVIAAFFTALMGLILVELLSSIRTVVEFGDTTVRLTVPRASGPTPKFRYATHEIPYTDIDRIETRREIYGGTLAPVKLMGSRIVKKDGNMVRLGFVSEANTDPALPFPEIAAKLAERSGVPIKDMGSVWRTVTQRMFGVAGVPGAAAGAQVEPEQIEFLNKRHRKVVLSLVFFLMFLVGLGIAGDLVIGTEG